MEKIIIEKDILNTFDIEKNMPRSYYSYKDDCVIIYVSTSYSNSIKKLNKTLISIERLMPKEPLFSYKNLELHAKFVKTRFAIQFYFVYKSLKDDFPEPVITVIQGIFEDLSKKYPFDFIDNEIRLLSNKYFEKCRVGKFSIPEIYFPNKVVSRVDSLMLDFKNTVLKILED